jgi:hypothetical protein
MMPEGEAVRKAIKWISEQVSEHPQEKPQKFVFEAITRFDLSPKDADFVVNFYRSQKPE